MGVKLRNTQCPTKSSFKNPMNMNTNSTIQTQLFKKFYLNIHSNSSINFPQCPSTIQYKYNNCPGFFRKNQKPIKFCCTCVSNIDFNFALKPCATYYMPLWFDCYCFYAQSTSTFSKGLEQLNDREECIKLQHNVTPFAVQWSRET